MLIEFLDGQSLGDMVRGGQDDHATAHLADVAARIGRNPDGASGRGGLVPLEQHIRALFTTDPSKFFAGHREWLAAAQLLARKLLASAPPPRSLHGDLHHDNILSSQRGWCAIDPKGLWGDPAYEVANAFPNPEGAGRIVRDPARISRMASVFSARLDVPMGRILDWAQVHIVCAACWSIADGMSGPGDLDILRALVGVARDA